MFVSLDNQKALLETSSSFHLAVPIFDAILQHEKIYLAVADAREVHRVTLVPAISETRARVQPVTDKNVTEDGSHVQES